MSIIGSNVLAGASGSGVEAYEIEQSLRFDGSHYLTRTPSSAGNRKTWTMSMWVKYADDTNTRRGLFGMPTGASNSRYVQWYIHNYNLKFSGYDETYRRSDAMFRDHSAWYHVVLRSDTTQSSEPDRLRIYINGELITARNSAQSTIDVPQNQEWGVNNTDIHYIGTSGGTSQHLFKGYIAEFYLVDGSSLAPTSFGEFDDNNVWRPIQASISSYGTNGVYLKFDETATNGIGHDHSGNGNNFTPTGFTTSGTGTDVMSDTPTKNFNTLNSAIRPYTATPAEVLSNGNLKLTCSSSSVSGSAWSTMLITSGKWYWEATLATAGASNNTVGWCNSTVDAGIGTNTADLRTNGVCYLGDNGEKVINTTKTSYGDSFTAKDVIGAQLDADAGTITFYKNGVSQGDITGQSPQSDSAGWLAAVEGFNGTVWDVNFGQREFAHPPGTASFTDHFAVVTYTGNGSTQSVTGCGFQPDMVWIKCRSTTTDHVITDVVRGATKTLRPNVTNVEYTQSDALTSFDSDGFTLGDDNDGGPAGNFNIDTRTYVAWCWKAGGSGSSNTDGSITSTVSANTTAGFSIVSYTGTGAGATVGHGLGVAPDMFITKNRDASVGWGVYHKDLGGNTKYLNLNDSAAANTNANIWNSTSPTSTVFSVGADGTGNGTGEDMIAYCFAEKSGYTKIGSYTANNSTDGPEVDLGFRPAFLLLKADASANWQMFDSQRRSDDGMLRLRADYLPGNEGDPGTLVFTNTGFRIISADADVNSPNGTTFIYLALSESFVSGDFKALNTANLPAPEIKDGSDYFNTVLYSGNGSTQSITGVGFQPDWVLIKDRVNSADNWNTFDAVRGVTKVIRPNLNHAEATDANSLTSFDSDGFSLGTRLEVNRSTSTFASWNWLAGGSGSSNTNGSITSTVSVSATSGFSIVSYEGNVTAGATIGHGLGVAPEMMIVKNRDTSGYQWVVYHKDIGATKYLYLSDNRQANTYQHYWNNTAPSSTVFTLGTDIAVNGNGDNIIAYCFAEVEGYSKFGSYTGNASTDGPFVYCGFRPSWVLTKRTGGADNWFLYDTARDEYNQAFRALDVDTSDVEKTSATIPIDILSNGFKIRSSGTAMNATEMNVFVAFAENPFGGDGVSPATAR